MRKPRDLAAYPRDQMLGKYLASVVKRGDSECWGWTGSTNHQGYGVVIIPRAVLRANRVACFIFNGPFDPTLDVLHLCHNPECTNPAHLKAGTRRENMQTSRAVGRMQRRIPLEDLGTIQRRRADGETWISIAKSYGCSAPAVRHMINSRGIDDTMGRRSDKPKLITYNGQTLSVREWAKRIGIPFQTLRFRYVRQGWSAERSLTTPIARGDAASRKPLHL